MVTEIDEGALPRVAPEIRPRAVLVTNLFRDQLDRYGEIYAVADAFEVVAARAPARQRAGRERRRSDRGRTGPGPRRSSGDLRAGPAPPRPTPITRAADTIRCPACRANLEYEHVYLSHMGSWRCPACGLARPALDVAVTAVEVKGLAETRFTVRTPAGEQEFSIPQSGLHVAYDAAAAVALAVGLGVPIDAAPAALAAVGTGLRAAGADHRRSNRTWSWDSRRTRPPTTPPSARWPTEELPRHLLIAVSNTLVDGEDFGWLWDVDFESAVPRIEAATVSGLRADELANRLKYAGLDPVRMTVIEERVPALDAALAGDPGRRAADHRGRLHPDHRAPRGDATRGAGLGDTGKPDGLPRPCGSRTSTPRS